MELRQFTIVDGHPATAQGWVYAWVWPDGVRYVGATWLDPAVRAEAHLHRATDDPRSLALRAMLASEQERPIVVAAPTPVPAARQAHRLALVGRLRSEGLLSAQVVASGPVAPRSTDPVGVLDAARPDVTSPPTVSPGALRSGGPIGGAAGTDVGVPDAATPGPGVVEDAWLDEFVAGIRSAL